ncbi:MAG TPA: 4-amino-4-deoxy-L-arabinose transferase [Nocardioides sp.]|uniref:uridine kinase family protein n=1 Tax=uncultured Nocardioides sp. TaxID=198441 RepID=UPI002604C3CE|nr:4-amino-4-deoxy-L-arabinose transferase [uncultured Nocardioides sp.]HRI97270.1 4-amino-4-deoxy-L-arabinose transferase [Nocardioides sp.]HRK45540.1 4-amino-4-deoxy-L-arabinose transferase [Nocardioides sp.]
MATGSPSDVAGVVVTLAAGRAVTLGGGRLVCVDGPAGSGKTTLAAEIAARTGAVVIHGDDLMEGWGGFATVSRQLVEVITELAAGRTGHYRVYDWHQGRFDASVSVPPGPWLVVEGVGSSEPAIAPYVTALVWVEVDDELRLARGLARDGDHLEQHWRTFMGSERDLFDRFRSQERADVLVDGTGARPPVVRPG